MRCVCCADRVRNARPWPRRERRAPQAWPSRRAAQANVEATCLPSAMKLTAFTDYSLRVLIYLAAQPERRATIAEIAASFAVSEHHLTKVVHFLGKHGWLANVRGKG